MQKKKSEFIEQTISKLLFSNENNMIQVGDYAALITEIEVTNEANEVITTNEILLYKLLTNSIGIKTWQQQEIKIPSPSNQINFNNEEELLHYEQLQYIKDILNIVQTKFTIEHYNKFFTNYRCESIIQYLKKKIIILM